MKDKEWNRQRDALSAERRKLLWHRLLGFLGRPASESGILCRDGGGSRTGRPPSKGAKVGFAPMSLLERLNRHWGIRSYP
jgi:hypothetical protein